MCALIQAMVQMRMNIRLVFQPSQWKSLYAFCRKLESGHGMLASPLSPATSVLTHKMLPLSFFLWPVDSSDSLLSRAKRLVIVWVDLLRVGGIWESSASDCRACNSAFFFCFLVHSSWDDLNRVSFLQQVYMYITNIFVVLWPALIWRSWWGSKLVCTTAKLCALLTTHGVKSQSRLHVLAVRT